MTLTPSPRLRDARFLPVKWVLYVHNYVLSWAGGASGTGHIEAILYFDIDGQQTQSAPRNIRLTVVPRFLVLVLPLTSTNTTLVQIFSTFECMHFARVPGALHARESSHEKQ